MGGSDKLWPLDSVVKAGEQPKGQHEYQFQYAVTQNPDAIEEWYVAQVEVVDKGGNARLYHQNEVNINFSVCPNVLIMAESLFNDGTYEKVLEALNLATAHTDRSRYIMSLTHHKLNSKQNALESFLQIGEQLPYLMDQ